MKPILFNTEMVRAILDGRKTVTRRVVKPVALGMTYEDGCPARNPPYRPGDILYVRETWGDYSECHPGGAGYYLYRADYQDGAKTDTSWDGVVCDLPRWRPSIHMPKEAARLFLRVTDVRVERVQDITEEQAEAEGITENMFTAIGAFGKLWDSTIKPADRTLYGWAANPWVWVIEFQRITKEEAEHGRWIPVDGGQHKCSCCHTVRKTDGARDHHCPHCGAKMSSPTD